MLRRSPSARRSRLVPAVAALLAVGAPALAVPAAADAHGLAGGRELPIPEWLFAWAAAIVLVVSFVGLTVLWHRPRLAALAEGRALRVPVGAQVAGHVALGALGVGLYGLTIWAGLSGIDNPQSNLAPTMVYVGFWVGVPVLSLVVGDVWHAMSPWRAIADAGGWIARRAGGRDALPAPLRYPERVGAWPAAAVLLVFAWLELAAGNRDDPQLLGVLALLYGAAMLVGCGLYGTAFLDRADGFGRYFGLAATLAPVHWERGLVRLRAPGSGLATIEPSPGLAAVVLTLIGTTTFDGISNGELWSSDGALGTTLEDLFGDLGLGASNAATAAATVGILLAVGLVTLFVRLGVAGVRSVDRERLRDVDLLGRFAPTLAPIAIGYAVAHYVSLLLIQGQALGFLLSDPRGDGSNLFGTAGWGVDYGIISPEATWYLQVAALVGGHVAGLVAAHDLALRTFRGPRAAVRSQYWMLAVMVAFTSLGLWLLS